MMFLFFGFRKGKLRSLWCGYNGGYKEATFTSEYFFDGFRCSVNHIFVVVSFLAHTTWGES